MYTENNNGPNIKPWGTQQVITPEVDILFSILIDWVSNHDYKNYCCIATLRHQLAYKPSEASGVVLHTQIRSSLELLWQLINTL